MNIQLRKVLGYVGAIWFIILFVAGFMAYFVTSPGAYGPCDGLGRNLTQAPLLMRVIFIGASGFVGGFFIG